MRNWVLGFCFSADRRNVVLIQKKRGPVPEHIGRYNGIGGKIEPDDGGGYNAMVREFEEETGVRTQPADWEYRMDLHVPNGRVNVFTAFSDEYVLAARTVTDEKVRSLRWREHTALYESFLVPNMSWIIPMVLDPDLIPVAQVNLR